MSERRVAFYLACLLALAGAGLYAGSRPRVVRETIPASAPRVSPLVLGSYALSYRSGQEIKSWQLRVHDVTARRLTCEVLNDESRLWVEPGQLLPNGAFTLRLRPYPGERGETWELDATLGTVGAGEARVLTPDGRSVTRALTLTPMGKPERLEALASASVFLPSPAAPPPAEPAPPRSRFLAVAIPLVCGVLALPLLISVLLDRKRSTQKKRVRIETRSIRRPTRRRRGAQPWAKRMSESQRLSTLTRDALRSSDRWIVAGRGRGLSAQEALEALESPPQPAVTTPSRVGALQVHRVGSDDDIGALDPAELAADAPAGSYEYAPARSRFRMMVDGAWGSGESLHDSEGFTPEPERIRAFHELESNDTPTSNGTLTAPSRPPVKAPSLRRSTASRRLERLLGD